MKNTWLSRNFGRTPVDFILATVGLKVSILPSEVKGWYPIGMGAGTRIVLKDGKEYLVRENKSTVDRRLKKS